MKFIILPEINFDDKNLSSQKCMSSLQTILRVLSQICLLEYAQAQQKSKSLNYWIFSRFQTDDAAYCWEMIKKIFGYMHENQLSFVTPLSSLIEKYPSLLSYEEDRLERMLWFYELYKKNHFALSKTDLSEFKTYLQELYESLSFLNQITENNPSPATAQQNFTLEPFFECSQGKEDAKINSNKFPLREYCHKWFTEEFAQYREEKKGIVDFSGKISGYKSDYVIPPWKEIEIIEVFSEIFNIPLDMRLRKIRIQGFPNTGKTALAANLEGILKNTCDYTFAYFIEPETIYQDSATFKFWFYRQLKKIFHIDGEIISYVSGVLEATEHFQKLQDNLYNNDQKIVIAIDNIDAMHKAEWLRLKSFIEEEIFSSIVFVLLQRSHTENQIAVHQTIELPPEDNVYFDESFTVEQINQLYQRYIGDNYINKKILKYLIDNYESGHLAVPIIADHLKVYTPKVHQSIRQMFPILEIMRDSNVRLFHPVCKKML